MAENQEDRSTEDLGEEASQARIDEYRGKGQVYQSREVTSLLVLVGCVMAIYLFAPSMAESMAEYMRHAFRADEAAKLDLQKSTVIGDTLLKCLKVIVAVGLPVSIAGFVFGLLGSFMQVGSVFSFDPLTPTLDKIDPIAGATRLFSMKTLGEGARLIFKAGISVTVAYSLVKTDIFGSPTELLKDPAQLFQSFAQSGKGIFWALLFIFAIFAGVDFWNQRRQWMKQVRLTKQEAKEEAKEREGNPQIKARIRTIQREMARKRMMAAVKKADVIITNPTHIAIAIQYSRDKMLAPRVVAKGADFIAQRIKQLAAEAGIPTVENVPLARTLYKTVKLNQYIPHALYQAVAEVLAFVYRLKNTKF